MAALREVPGLFFQEDFALGRCAPEPACGLKIVLSLAPTMSCHSLVTPSLTFSHPALVSAGSATALFISM